MSPLRRHIGTRITLAMTSVLALLLLSGSAWLNDRLDDNVRQWVLHQARTHAHTLLSILQTLMLNGEGTLAREWINRMHGVAGIRDIEILRHDGQETFTDLATVTAVNRFLGALTAWVIEQTREQAATWRQDGLELDIAITLSMHDLESDQLIQHIERLLARRRA